MKNLIVRSITGVVFVLVIINAIYWDPLVATFALGVLALLTMLEFYRLIFPPKTLLSTRIISSIAGTYAVVATSCYFIFPTLFTPLQLIAPYMCYHLYTFINELYAKHTNPLDVWSYTILGHLYIAFPFALLNLLCHPWFVTFPEAYNPIFLLVFFAFIWLNDSGAYLVGMSIGKHRLFERISPKKSWEGFFGGLFTVILASWLCAQYIPFDLSVYQWLGFGLVTSIASVMGDLCESLLKRTLHTKDSGHLLPGHGGMLDRFDSVLLAAPAVILYFIFVG